MSLSSLIVQRGVASPREVEEALARQVLYGGDLITNLLEVSRIDESRVSSVLAEAFGLPSAPVGALPAPNDRARALVPSELAMGRAMVPLTADEDTLTLAVSEPLPSDVEDELSFALGVAVLQQVAPSFRVRQALSDVYGVPLERRMQRLLSRVTGKETGASKSFPPLVRNPDVPVQAARAPDPPPLGFRMSPSHGMPAVRTEGGMPRRNTAQGFPAVRPRAALELAETETADDRSDETSGPITDVTGGPPPISESSTLENRRVTQTDFLAVRMAQDAAAARRGGTPAAVPTATIPSITRTLVPPKALVESADPVHAPAPARMPAAVVTTLAASKSTPHVSLVRVGAMVRRGRRRRGPITEDAAKKELEDAQDRDAVLDLFFDFTRQFFDYSALFIVQGDLAEGRDAFGDGASREKVTTIGVPLDLPGMLRKVRASGTAMRLVPCEDLDQLLLGDLGRAIPQSVFVAPVAVRTRVVALLVGDSGEQELDQEGERQVVELAALTAKALVRVIAKKKTRPRAEASESDDVARAESSSTPPMTLASPSAPELDPDAPTPIYSSKDHPASHPAVVSPSSPPHQRPAMSWSPGTGAGRPESAPTSDTRVHALSQIGKPVGKEGAPPNAFVARVAGARPIPREEPAASNVQAVSIGARRPPSAYVAAEELPSIMVDVDREFGDLVARVAAEGKDERAEEQLIRAGQAAMPAIMARFAGPITIAPERIAVFSEGVRIDAPRASECGPILRLIASQRRVAFPFVLERLADPDPERRFWATLLLAELPYAEAVRPLVTRLFDQDKRVRHAARLAARAMPEVARTPIVDHVATILHSASSTVTARVTAIETLADIREPLGVPVLASALNDPDESVIQAAMRGLVTLTFQDFERDEKKWVTWWTANAGRHRIEWLIEALLHESANLRRGAADELKSLTKQTFGYYADDPRRERERAHQTFRDWWAQKGRALFRRD